MKRFVVNPKNSIRASKTTRRNRRVVASYEGDIESAAKDLFHRLEQYITDHRNFVNSVDNMVTWWEDEAPYMSALKLSDVIDGVKEDPEILDMDDPYDQLYEFDIDYVPMVSAIKFYRSNGIEIPDWIYEELDSRNFW